MIHDWIPDRRWIMSINPPSWSISTEFLFYLLFPWLINNLNKNYAWKLGGFALFTAAWLVITASVNPPEIATGLTIKDLIYFNPLSRIFEFTLGMACCLFFKRSNHLRNLPTWLCTAAEFATIGLIFLHLFTITNFTETWQSTPIARAARDWVILNGNCFSYSLLILLFAVERGAVSKLLTKKPLVFLGEISYSLYLLHFVALLIFQKAQAKLPFLHSYEGAEIFVLLLLTVSYLTFALIETPCRRWLRPRKPAPDSAIAESVIRIRKSWAPKRIPTFVTIDFVAVR